MRVLLHGALVRGLLYDMIGRRTHEECATASDGRMQAAIMLIL